MRREVFPKNQCATTVKKLNALQTEEIEEETEMVEETVIEGDEQEVVEEEQLSLSVQALDGDSVIQPLSLRET